MKKVGFIGECMIELNGQAFGEMKQHFGGDTFNSALYLHRLEPSVRPFYISAVGNDELSKQLLTLWQREGIDSSLTLIDQENQTGLYQISLDSKGERTFSYWRKQSAASKLLQHPEFDDVKKQLFEFEYLYLSGISIAIFSKQDKAIFIALLTELHAHGVKIIFDSNYREKLWDSPQEAQYYYKKIIPLCDYALITFDDEVELWGDQTINDAKNRLYDLGLKKFVLKLGAEGCHLFQWSENQFNDQLFVTEKVENVVDTTSAGDSFNAGFISQLIKNNDPKLGCQVGNQLAGLVIQYKGAIIPKSITNNFVIVNNKKIEG